MSLLRRLRRGRAGGVRRGESFPVAPLQLRGHLARAAAAARRRAPRARHRLARRPGTKTNSSTNESTPEPTDLLARKYEFQWRSAGGVQQKSLLSLNFIS